MARGVGVVACATALVAAAAVWLFWPWVALVVAPWPPGCSDGPCVWTADDGPTPLLARDEFWIIARTCVSGLLVVAGVWCLARAWLRPRPTPTRAGTSLRWLDPAATLAAELVAAALGARRTQTIRVLSATYWVAMLACAVASTTSHRAAAELQVRFYAPLLLVLAATAGAIGTAAAYGLVREAADRVLLAAWGCTLLATAAVWYVMSDLGPPGARLAPFVGLLVLAGHAAALAALALRERARTGRA